MSISPGQRSDDGEGVAPGVLTEADRALLLAMRAWAHECRRPDGAGLHGEHAFILRFWDWLEAGWVRRLCDAWDREQKAGDGMAAARAIERLRAMHIATIEASFSHVHPSWMVRALREESPAVQRLVAASVPGPLRQSLQAGLLLDAEDITPDRAVQPMVQEWVMGLWTERLVGGEASRPDDAPALVAVCRISNRAGYRLCRVAGLGKMVVAGVKPAKATDRALCAAGWSGWKAGLAGAIRSFARRRGLMCNRWPDRSCPGAGTRRASVCSHLRGCLLILSRSGCGGRCNTGRIRS